MATTGQVGGGKIDLHEIQSTLIEVAKQAGEMITTASKKRFNSPASPAPAATSSTGTKKNSADLVTETDQAVEAMVSRTLLGKYPDFKFLGEETYKPGMQLGPEPTFVVDPIDGTTNFVHGWPYVSISLAFAVDRKPQVGVVYNPFDGKMYTGIAGEGSYLQVLGSRREGQEEKEKLPLKSEELHSLDNALVAIEWGSDRSGQNWQTKCDTFRRLGASKDEGGAMVHSARALGSAALNLCAVAAGTIDLYWEGGCWAWDVCAGWVVLTEAGGMIVDGNPGRWEIPVDNRKYLAVRRIPNGNGNGNGNGTDSQSQKKIVQEFWALIEGRLEYES